MPGRPSNGGVRRGARCTEQRSPCLASHPASVAIPMQGTGAAARRPEQQPEQMIIVAAPVPPPPPGPGQQARDCKVEGSSQVSAPWCCEKRSSTAKQVLRTATRRQGREGRSSSASQVLRSHGAELRQGREVWPSDVCVFAWVARPPWQYGPDTGILSPSQSHIHTHPHTPVSYTHLTLPTKRIV